VARTYDSVNGYYAPGPDHDLPWPLFRAMHFPSIRNAAANRALTPGSAELHSDGLLSYIRNELQMHVPDPLIPSSTNAAV
jgi:hypothetical protein